MFKPLPGRYLEVHGSVLCRTYYSLREVWSPNRPLAALPLRPEVAGTRASAAVPRISCRNAVKSLIVLVATVGGDHSWKPSSWITRDATMRKMTEQQFDDVITVHLRCCWNGT